MTHRVNANLVRLSCQAHKDFIKSSEKLGAIRFMSNDHDEQSFVGAVQGFWNMFVTASEAKGFAFYPLHPTLMKFTNERRPLCIE